MIPRGHYQTRQQDAVEAYFEAHPEDCLEAEEIFRALLEQGEKVGKTTVYRAITRLCDAGRVRRYATEERGGASLYQYNPCRESHLHIRCVYCGALEHLHCEEVEAFCGHLKKHHGFTLDEGQTVLYGCCEACGRNRNEE